MSQSLRPNRALKAAIAAAAIAVLGIACGSSLAVREVGSRAHQPANVEVLFQVSARDEPVLDLTSQQVKVFDEQHQPLSQDTWALANQDMRDRMQVALLLDFGGSPTAAQRTQLAAGAKKFVEKLGGRPRVAVYAFDGAPQPQALLAFDTPAEQTADAMKAIDSFAPRDNSTDLYGSYLQVHREVRTRVEAAGVELGAIVLVARGPDAASRVAEEDLRGATRQRESAVDRYLVAVGEPAQKASLDWLATRKPVTVTDTTGVAQALEQLAVLIDGRGKSLYLLSYCSAARAGKHRIDVEVQRSLKNEKGDEEQQSGGLTHSYDATGFGPGCDPKVATAGRWEPTPEASADAWPQPAASVSSDAGKNAPLAGPSGAKPKTKKQEVRLDSSSPPASSH